MEIFPQADVEGMKNGGKLFRSISSRLWAEKRFNSFCAKSLRTTYFLGTISDVGFQPETVIDRECQVIHDAVAGITGEFPEGGI